MLAFDSQMSASQSAHPVHFSAAAYTFYPEAYYWWVTITPPQQLTFSAPLTAFLPRRLRRRRGRHGRHVHLVEGGDLLPGQPLAGLGAAQQQFQFVMFPLVSVSPGLVPVIRCCVMFTVPPSGRSAPSFR